VPALARLRLFPGHSPNVDSAWRAEKGEVLSKICWLPCPPPWCLPPFTSSCCQCLRWSAWPCAAFSPSALSRGARAWRRCGSLSSIRFETCFRGPLFVIRSPSYLIWSRASLLGVGLTDLSHFGWHLGQNKAIVSAFNKSVVYFKVRAYLSFELGLYYSSRTLLFLPTLKDKNGR
jgi:hypothetical protein